MKLSTGKLAAIALILVFPCFTPKAVIAEPSGEKLHRWCNSNNADAEAVCRSYYTGASEMMIFTIRAIAAKKENESNISSKSARQEARSLVSICPPSKGLHSGSMRDIAIKHLKETAPVKGRGVLTG